MTKKKTPKEVSELIALLKERGSLIMEYIKLSDEYTQKHKPDPNEVLKSLRLKTEEHEPFDKKRRPGEAPKPRNKKSPKKDAFITWVKDFKIDSKLSLDRLVTDVEEAYQRGEIKFQIGRDTVRDCLPIIRGKKN